MIDSPQVAYISAAKKIILKISWRRVRKFILRKKKMGIDASRWVFFLTQTADLDLLRTFPQDCENNSYKNFIVNSKYLVLSEFDLGAKLFAIKLTFRSCQT